MKKLSLLSLVFVLAFSSCEQDANVDLPEVESQLVLNCFITPQDSFIRVRVSKSNPVFAPVNTTNYNVSNATITLYGNSSSVNIPYNSGNETYELATSVFPIIPGNEYRLVVTEPGGLQAEATTTVPLNAPAGFTCTAFDTIDTSDPWGTEGETRYDLSLSDPSGTNNYYRFVAYDVHYESWNNDSSMQRTGWSLFSDENLDGTTIQKRISTWFYTSSSDSIIAHKVFMMHCNYDYYRFHLSLSNYNYGDPFSEPTLIYTNVTGGLGIFAAANSAVRRIPY